MTFPIPSHSPGPWTFDHTGGGQVRATDDKGSFPVCDIRGWGHLTGKGHGALGLTDAEAIAIQAANARLIAAAPDMLEALMLSECAENTTTRLGGMELEAEAYRKRIAAITKAIGDGETERGSEK